MQLPHSCLFWLCINYSPCIPLLAPSGQPSNSSGVSLNSTHILLTWDPPPLNETHGDIQGYRITTVEQETGNIGVYSTEDTEVVAGPLHPYYTYNFSIQAVTVEPGPPIIIITRTQETGIQHMYASHL